MYNSILLEDTSFVTRWRGTLSGAFRSAAVLPLFFSSIMIGLSLESSDYRKKTWEYIIWRWLQKSILSSKTYTRFLSANLAPIEKVLNGWRNDKYLIAHSPRVVDVVTKVILLLTVIIGLTIGLFVSKSLEDYYKKSNVSIVEQNKSSDNQMISYLYTLYFLMSIIKQLESTSELNKNITNLKPQTIDELLSSKDNIEVALGKALTIASTKYAKQLNAYKIKYYRAQYRTEKDAVLYAYMSVKSMNSLIFIGPEKTVDSLSEDEIIAIWLHEIGHSLSISQVALSTFLVVNLIAIISSVLDSTRGSILSTTHLILKDIIQDISTSMNSLQAEQIADTFVAQFGYASDLRNALTKAFSQTKTNSNKVSISARNSLLLKITTHPDIESRVEYLGQLNNMIKDTTKVTYDRALEVIKSREKGNV